MTGQTNRDNYKSLYEEMKGDCNMMNKAVLDNIKLVDIVRNKVINEYGVVPKITAKRKNGKSVFTITV